MCYTVGMEELQQPAQALDGVVRFVIRQTAALREGSFTSVSTLSTLDSTGPCRLTDLAVREGVSQPSMTSLVARLARQGLVSRGTDPSDGRIVLVAITDAGREVLRRRGASRVAFVASLIGALDPADQAALAQAVPALHRLADVRAVPAALAAAKEATTDEHVEK
jgi:DNA-binding MarR family transcriptional regulator